MPDIILYLSLKISNRITYGENGEKVEIQCFS